MEEKPRELSGKENERERMREQVTELLVGNTVYTALKDHGHGEGGQENLKSTAENS